jgi:hypothetical protein
MTELLVTNIIYVFYRLAISAPLVKFVNKYFTYYVAVIIMAQLSFAYDYFVFENYFTNGKEFVILELIKSDILYTLRVIAAWWLIKQIWDRIGNYWVAVFIGAEITFICDYFIFADLLRG